MSQSLKQVIEELTGAYYEEAPEDTAYPYVVFSMRRISESDGRQSYSLEINAWDQYAYYSRVENMMDALEKKLHQTNRLTEEYLIRIFKGARQNVPDQDKSIKRVREQFELYVYEREE